MIKDLMGAFMSAASVHPVLAAFVSLVLMAQAVYSIETFATKAELRSLEVKVDRRYLDQRIYDIESEMFGIERVIEGGKARDVDYGRLSKLRSQLGAAKRELGLIGKAGSSL